MENFKLKETPISPRNKTIDTQKKTKKREQHGGGETQHQYKRQEQDEGLKRLDINGQWLDQIMLILNVLRWTLCIIILPQMKSTKQKHAIILLVVSQQWTTGWIYSTNMQTTHWENTEMAKNNNEAPGSTVPTAGGG